MLSRIRQPASLGRFAYLILMLGIAAVFGVPPGDTTGQDAAENPSLVRARLHAVLVSDDDGSRSVRITPAQVGQWVDYANRVYASAGIQLDFDASASSADVSTVRSTLLNSMTGTGDPDWNAERAQGNAMAARYPGAVTAFFRYGPGPSPTGQSFSSSGGYDFITMGGFNDAIVCGKQNIQLFAHELGHYLGLAHTFSQVFSSISAAEDYFKQHGRDRLAFDGDGIEDTLPDPYVDQPQIQCSPIDSLKLLGVAFTLPRTTLMSYYGDQIDKMAITPIQADIVRQGFLLRVGQSVDKIITGDGPPVLEAEDLPVAVTAGNTTKQNMYVDGFWGVWSNRAQLFWAGAGPGAHLTLQFQVQSPGHYEVFLRPTRAPDYGIFQHRLDGVLAGPPTDLYSRIVRLGELISLGTFQLSTGTHTLSAEIVGANSHTVPDRFFYGLDYILLKQRG